MINVGRRRIANILPNGLIKTRGPADKKTLYLTFDDGPNKNFTLSVCDLLEQYNARGSFFLIGNNIKKYPEITNQLVMRGHLIANHSDTHSQFGKKSLTEQVVEVENCQAKLSEVDPTTKKIFRAPQGNLDLVLLLSLLVKRWKIVHWSYDSLDYKVEDADYYFSLFEQHPVTNGDILLFHDDNNLCLEILSVLLPKWVSLGFEFKTVVQ